MEYRTSFSAGRAIAAALALSALTSCAALLPNTVGPELAHASHLSQHRPFTTHPQNYGYQTVGVVAHWRVGGFYLDAGESYNFAPTYGQDCAGLCGSREVFTARVGYLFQVRP